MRVNQTDLALFFLQPPFYLQLVGEGTVGFPRLTCLLYVQLCINMVMSNICQSEEKLFIAVLTIVLLSLVIIVSSFI